MFTSFYIGNLLGRVVASAIILYVILVLFERGNWRVAIMRMKRLSSVIIICILFFFGLIGSARAEEGHFLSAEKIQELTKETAPRPFTTLNAYAAGLKVLVPFSPKWHWEGEERPNGFAIQMTTPEKYYPTAAMEIVAMPHLNVSGGDFKKIALSALITVRQNAGVSATPTAQELIEIQFGLISGYADQFTMTLNGIKLSAFSVAGHLPDGKPVMLFVSTPEGQMEAIFPMINKIWKNIKEIPAKK